MLCLILLVWLLSATKHKQELHNLLDIDFKNHAPNLQVMNTTKHNMKRSTKKETLLSTELLTRYEQSFFRSFRDTEFIPFLTQLQKSNKSSTVNEISSSNSRRSSAKRNNHQRRSVEDQCVDFVHIMQQLDWSFTSGPKLLSYLRTTAPAYLHMTVPAYARTPVSIFWGYEQKSAMQLINEILCQQTTITQHTAIQPTTMSLNLMFQQLSNIYEATELLDLNQKQAHYEMAILQHGDRMYASLQDDADIFETFTIDPNIYLQNFMTHFHHYPLMKKLATVHLSMDKETVTTLNYILEELFQPSHTERTAVYKTFHTLCKKREQDQRKEIIALYSPKKTTKNNSFLNQFLNKIIFLSVICNFLGLVYVLGLRSYKSRI